MPLQPQRHASCSPALHAVGVVEPCAHVLPTGLQAIGRERVISAGVRNNRRVHPSPSCSPPTQQSTHTTMCTMRAHQGRQPSSAAPLLYDPAGQSVLPESTPTTVPPTTDTVPEQVCRQGGPAVWVVRLRGRCCNGCHSQASAYVQALLSCKSHSPCSRPPDRWPCFHRWLQASKSWSGWCRWQAPE